MNKKLTCIFCFFLIVALIGITLGYTGYLLGYREGYIDALKDREEPPVYYVDNRTIIYEIDNRTIVYDIDNSAIKNNACNNSNRGNACNNGKGKKYGWYKP